MLELKKNYTLKMLCYKLELYTSEMMFILQLPKASYGAFVCMSVFYFLCYSVYFYFLTSLILFRLKA